MEKKSPEKIKVIRLFKEDGAYGFEICEVLEDQLKPIEKSVPDIFAIFTNQLTKATRDLFGF